LSGCGNYLSGCESIFFSNKYGTNHGNAMSPEPIATTLHMFL